MRKIYITGYGFIPGGRYYDKGFRELAGEVFLKAWDMIGNEKIDMVIIASAYMDIISEQLISSSYVCEYLSFENVPSLRVEVGDGSSGIAILQAISFLQTGNFENIAVIGVEKVHDVTSFKLNKFLTYLTDFEHEGYFGITPLAISSLITREYLMKYGYSYEDLAQWVIKMHERGSKNPYAFMKKKASLKDILSSEVVADPLRLYDIAPPIDGAACVILSTKPIKSNFVIEIEEYSIGAHNVAYNLRCDRDRLKLKSLENAWSKISSKIEIEKLGFVEVHDVYSILGVLAIESLKLCNQGEALKLIKNGYFDDPNKIIVNASGGLKSIGYAFGASGLYQLVFLVMELLGVEPFKEISKKDLGIVHDMAGIDRISTLLILKRIS